MHELKSAFAAAYEMAARTSTAALTDTSPMEYPTGGFRALVTSKSGAIAAMTSVSTRILRANGPTQLSVDSLGTTPRRETRPNVGFSPITPQQAAGPRIDPPVSVPSAASARPSPTADAEPLDEPPGMRVGFCGLTAVPV